MAPSPRPPRVWPCAALSPSPSPRSSPVPCSWGARVRTRGRRAPSEPSPAERLSAAKATFDAAGSVQLDLSSRDVPPRENGVTAAKGAGSDQRHRTGVLGHDHRHDRGRRRHDRGHRHRRDGVPEVLHPGLRGDRPRHPGSAQPGDVLRPGEGDLRVADRRRGDPTAAGRTRAGADVLDRIDGTLPGAPIEELFHLGDGTGTYRVSYGLTSADELRTATLVGPFFPGVEATYLLSLTDYGAPVEITRP